MGLPVGPLLVNIFISLEQAVLPTIKKYVAHWKRYVDDTHVEIHPSKIKYALEKLTGHHPNPLSANATKWSNTFKQFVSKSRRIVCLAILWGWRLKGLYQFTYEIEENKKITFLDVLITRKGNNKLVATRFRKATHRNMHINWNSGASCIEKREH